MPSLSEILPERRYLVMSDVLAAEWIADIRANGIPTRLASRKLQLSQVDRDRAEAFLAIPQEQLGIPLLVTYPPADIPIGKTFEIVFRHDDPETYCESLLILKHVVTWDLVASHVWYGHHALCFFDCPLGPPAWIAEVPPSRDGTVLRAAGWLGLCDRNDWPAIRSGLLNRDN